MDISGLCYHSCTMQDSFGCLLMQFIEDINKYPSLMYRLVVSVPKRPGLHSESCCCCLIILYSLLLEYDRT